MATAAIYSICNQKRRANVSKRDRGPPALGKETLRRPSAPKLFGHRARCHAWRRALESSCLEDVESGGPGQDLHRPELQHLLDRIAKGLGCKTHGRLGQTFRRAPSNCLHVQHLHQTEAEQENRVARRERQDLRPVFRCVAVASRRTRHQ